MRLEGHVDKVFIVKAMVWGYHMCQDIWGTIVSEEQHAPSTKIFVVGEGDVDFLLSWNLCTAVSTIAHLSVHMYKLHQ